MDTVQLYIMQKILCVIICRRLHGAAVGGAGDKSLTIDEWAILTVRDVNTGEG